MECTLVVGLGNPGSMYRETRHNVGFLVAEELCRRWKKQLREGRGDYLLAELERGGRRVVLATPTTYMNNSGIAVAELIDRYETDPSSLLVVVDDLALPLGTLRLRHQGSDGGHNGLASVIYHLQTDVFPRIRCGIRNEEVKEGEETAGFVLSPFAPGEQEAAAAMVLRAADAVEMSVHAGFTRAMNVFNKTQ